MIMWKVGVDNHLFGETRRPTGISVPKRTLEPMIRLVSCERDVAAASVAVFPACRRTALVPAIGLVRSPHLRDPGLRAVPSSAVAAILLLSPGIAAEAEREKFTEPPDAANECRAGLLASSDVVGAALIADLDRSAHERDRLARVRA